VTRTRPLVAVEPDSTPPTGTPPTDKETTHATAGDRPAPSDGGAAPAPSGGAGDASSGGTGKTQAPPTANQVGPQEPLPRVTALGLSPDGSVYVLFEHGFIYRQPTAEEMSTQGFDPYSPQSPLPCQLFRADGRWKGDAPAGHDLAELECVTSQYQVPIWDGAPRDAV
jgi:hypothetical protein